MAELAVKLDRLELKNPVLLASGTVAYGEEISQFYPLKRLGGIFLKAVSKNPREGNRPPRIVETPSGVINSIGLANKGLAWFTENIVPTLRAMKTQTIANVVGDTVDDFVYVCEHLNQHLSVKAYELNVSCPNVHAGGRVFAEDKPVLNELITRCKTVSERPIIVKLPPYIFAIEEYAKLVEDAGANAISLTNTIPAFTIDPVKRTPRIGNNFGGLSGPAIMPVALRVVYLASKAVSIPIIGGGGIMTGKDAASFLIAGAHAVSVGTANMIDPHAGERIINELNEFLDSQNIANVNDLRGTLTLNE